MSTALAAHHAVLRRCARRHRCYEVKTIGDSRSCSRPTAADAVGFALDIQAELLAHDWGTDVFDAIYAEAGAWRGLRVRSGVDFGRGHIEVDPVTRRTDYYLRHLRQRHNFGLDSLTPTPSV